jgi:glycosyltransferase involved in cell wall biosynthesis
MLRYAEMMQAGLAAAGHEVILAAPQPALNSRSRPAKGVRKWLGYVDKFVLGTRGIAQAARWADVVHICDHSNAMYVPARARVPHVVTCHDLLAVRGALGEDTDCPASFAGKYLQRSILDGLRRAHAVACVSEATRRDAERLLGGTHGELVTAPNALAYPYRKIGPDLIAERFAALQHLEPGGYVLHVGSNLRRKNRECVLRAVAAASAWHGKVVLAGEPPSAELWALAERLSITDRIVAVPRPSNELLETLYNGALAMLFPSRFEGFGWPIIEAQACGCPVICSDREPLTEVASAAAVLCDADDSEAFGSAIVTLATDPASREALVYRGLANAARHDRASMIAGFVGLYERVLRRA